MTDWAPAHSPFTALLGEIGGDSSGWFSSLDDTTMTIDDVNRSSQPAGEDFIPNSFISVAADANGQKLGMDSMFDMGNGCAVLIPAFDQACTQDLTITVSGSPISFINNGGAAGTAGRSQTVASYLPAHRPVIGIFIATLAVPVQREPDSGYVLGSGVGLILLSLGSRRLLGKHQAK